MNPILVVDDNEQILDVLSRYIALQGWPCITARTGEEALEMFAASDPSVILLDIMLPGIDGLQVCRRIRKSSMVPILMITARDEDADRILGLDTGADDYIVKPFSPAEVMARLRATLRRIVPQSSETLVIGTLCINMQTRAVTVDGKRIELTRHETDLLWTLANAPGRVFTRDNLLNIVWGYDYPGNTRTVDTHVKRLRQKLDAVPHEDFSISTVWGSGYKFERQL